MRGSRDSGQTPDGCLGRELKLAYASVFERKATLERYSMEDAHYLRVFQCYLNGLGGVLLRCTPERCDKRESAYLVEERMNSLVDNDKRLAEPSPIRSAAAT